MQLRIWVCVRVCGAWWGVTFTFALWRLQIAWCHCPPDGFSTAQLRLLFRSDVLKGHGFSSISNPDPIKNPKPMMTVLYFQVLKWISCTVFKCSLVIFCFFLFHTPCVDLEVWRQPMLLYLLPDGDRVEEMYYNYIMYAVQVQLGMRVEI